MSAEEFESIINSALADVVEGSEPCEQKPLSEWLRELRRRARYAAEEDA